jgi:predicted PurR-regulated permease PerM
VRITIPRWGQLILIPVAIFLALYFGRAASHAVFVFLFSSLVALLLNPLVLGLGKIKVPRAAAVPIVYTFFVAVVVLLFVFFGPPLIRQFQRLFEALPDWLNSINQSLADLEGWLAGHNVDISLELNTTSIVNWLQTNGVQSVGTLFSVGVNVVGMVVNFVLTMIISFYMLMDGKRIFRFLCRLAPGDTTQKNQFVRGLQGAFDKFVRGQALLGASIGLAVGLAMWIFSWDMVGIWPEGGQYALLFGFWAGITEVIPYVGPFLGAAPVVVAAFFHSPLTAVWVIVAFLVIQQLESHILAPNIVGSTMGVHPLIVIFALLAGAQIAGILGMLAALPLLAMLKHVLAFYDFRLSRARWAGDDGVILIPARSAPLPPKEVLPEEPLE